jgi:hypothetical protein
MEDFSVNWKSRIHPVLIGIALLLTAECYGQVGSNTVDYGVNPLPFSRIGSAGWQFLKLPTDARSAAMGDIKSAVGFGNANSALTNPASTADIKDMDVQFSSMTWVADIKYSSISFMKNLGEWGSVGVSGIYVNYGNMERTEVAEGFGPAGNSLGIIPITEGLGTFSAHDLALGLVYSRRVTNFLQVGGTIRYCEEQLDDAKMKTWSLDVGTMYWTGIGSLRISMLGKNFGPDGQFLSYQGRIAQAPANVRLPMEFIIGAAYDVLEASTGSQHRLTVAAEYVKPNDGPDRYHVGAEYFAFSNIYLRGGYRFGYDEATYTFGLGMEYSVADEVKVKFDYAYSDVGRFQSVHVLTFGFGF